MSIDYQTYIGPYIQVHNPPVDSTEEIYTCSDLNCSNHRFRMSINNKYCPICGGPARLLSVSCKAPKEFYVDEETNERMYEAISEYKPEGMDNEMFIISNVKGTPGVEIGPHAAIEYAHVSPYREISEFTDTFASELAKIKAFFGANNVYVKWGILCWAS